MGHFFSKLWYDEIQLYNFTANEYMPDAGHFTQMAWASSKEVGFGLAFSPINFVFCVANYNPAGNYLNAFKKNIFPPKF